MSKIIVLSVASVGIVLMGFFAMHSRALERFPVGFVQQKAYVEHLFKAYSATEALGAFKKSVSEESQSRQHEASHIFGEILYEHLGIAGLSVCDSSFGFGCFHSFLGRAISEHGVSVLKELDDACVQKYGSSGTGCFHGLGHGILAYYGYSTANLEKSLNLCKTLSWQKELSGCSDGVFMEYNFRVMETDPTKRYRPFVLDERYKPCTDITVYKDACYFSLPTWWITTLQADAQKNVGLYCDDVVADSERRSCFRGIGYGAFPTVHFSPSEGADFCDAVSTGMQRVWCREGLAWAFLSDPEYRDKGEQVCTTGLSSADATQCTRESYFAT